MNDEYLFNYIKNNEIDIDIKEQLQDDYKFMMKVIDITNDKNYYHLCSSRVKNNYEFVNFLIDKFSDDKLFVGAVSYLCLQNNRIIDINYKEVLVKAYELLKNEERSFLSYYFKRMGEAFYKIEMNFINNYKEDNDIVDYSFIFIKFKYKDNYVLMDFFAKKFINEIFFKINFLEDLVHEYFNDYEEFKSYGVNNFLIYIIEKYDFVLADYVKCNVILLDSVKEKLESIEQNFNTYVKNEKNNLVSFEKTRKKLGYYREI